MQHAKCGKVLCLHMDQPILVHHVDEGSPLTGKLKTNTAIRAIQVRKAIENLGPAYVKVAQAVSTRVDVLDANYLIEIERLQDRVPPFPTPDALSVMTQGMCSLVVHSADFVL